MSVLHFLAVEEQLHRMTWTSQSTKYIKYKDRDEQRDGSEADLFPNVARPSSEHG